MSVYIIPKIIKFHYVKHKTLEGEELESPLYQDKFEMFA